MIIVAAAVVVVAAAKNKFKGLFSGIPNFCSGPKSPPGHLLG